MINRDNYLDVKAYLKYLETVRQNNPQTVKRRWGQLRHLLEWADETALPAAPTVQPTFAEYLLTARNDKHAKPLASATRKSTCETARAFFTWARAKHPHRYRAVATDWIEMLRPPKAPGSIKERDLFTVQDIQKLIALPAQTLTEQRDQAAIAFLFLSGARVGALVSFPIQAIDLVNNRIKQWPSLGVLTKNQKAATTCLLDIPEIFEPVARWDALVRSSLQPQALWYAPLTRDGMSFTGRTKTSKDRRTAVAKGMRQLCERAGVPYRSPHKVRHSHAVYALKRAEDVAAAKAISQNLMHESLTTTEGVYGVLTESDMRERISALTRPNNSPAGVNLDSLADSLVTRLLDRSDVFADAIVNVVAQRLLLQIEGTPDDRMPSLVGAPGFEPGTSTTPL